MEGEFQAESPEDFTLESEKHREADNVKRMESNLQGMRSQFYTQDKFTVSEEIVRRADGVFEQSMYDTRINVGKEWLIENHAQFPDLSSYGPEEIRAFDKERILHLVEGKESFEEKFKESEG